MNKKSIIILFPFALCLALLTVLSLIKERSEKGDDIISITNISSVRIGDDFLLPHTPIKNQGHIQACWIYAYLACIETERIEHYGDSLNLSPLWLINSLAHEQAEAYYLTKGKRKINLRGIGPEAEYLLKEYGIVPFSFFHAPEGLNSNMMERNISMKAKNAVNTKKGLSALHNDVNTALPRLPHNLEQGFYLYGMHYTPRQFGESILAGTKMRWLTSFTHHPFNKPFDIELPDNYRHHQIMNVTIDSLYNSVLTSLKNHHPVFWEGKKPSKDNKISKEERFILKEKNISDENNHSLNKSSGNKFTTIQSLRQRAFERFSISDDHAMAIIGIKKDKNGNTCFICKNSWGKEWGHKGFCLMKVEDLLINTIIVGVME